MSTDQRAGSLKVAVLITIFAAVVIGFTVRSIPGSVRPTLVPLPVATTAPAPHR